ncbi:MAG TPA: hypothetical protein VHH36_07695 [Candidatus Thermoplasmatota archaeon]|nr:hypothetical protein [Candidatus Thermoplasmatota archaeon]
MRPIVAAIALSALLVVAGAGLALMADDGADAPAEPAASAPAEHDHMRHGAGAHPWEGGVGAVPTMADALLTLERRDSIAIDGDAAFNPANGVRSGSGSFEDPFVISGWFVDTVLIKDTSRAFVFKENYVGRILILDWTGQGGYVHHNHVANLRTNRNVERTGDPSATVIEKNEILLVEELRHFDGEVRNNTIGDPRKPHLLREGVVLNIAGLNGAGIHDNVIHGGVDMKIHGHHHSDARGLSSHNHGRSDEVQNESHPEDHQVRYVDFLFYNNRIVDTGFGMRYNDLNHAGDDRTATSEQEPMLEKPHVHHTRVALRDNVIEGATLRVAAVNSLDERHLAGEEATLEIAHNRILKPAAGDGLVVQDVRNATVLVHDNVVEKGPLQLSGTSAILLRRFANASVVVGENAFGDYKYGVRAEDFDAATTWSVAGNSGPVDHPVYWDESVANPPQEAAGQEHAHAHGHGHADEPAAPADAVARLRSTFAPTR